MSVVDAYASFSSITISMQFSDYTRSPHSHVRTKQYTQFEQHCSILTPGPIEDGAFLKLRRTDDSIFYIKLHDSTLSARPRSLT